MPPPQLGARELLAKNATLAELMVSIRHALENREGEPGILPGTRYDLTPRQREVLSLIVDGLDNREIADRLGISERTARAHVSAVLHRLGAANRTQAAVAAVQKGILGLLALLVALAMLGGARRALIGRGREGHREPRDSARTRGRRGLRGLGLRHHDRPAARRLALGTPRTPASVEKLLTSSTALDRAGPERGSRPSVVTTGTIADGSAEQETSICGPRRPLARVRGLGRLARAIRAHGMSEITGQVYGDESYFDGRRGGPASGYGTSAWVGPLSALAFNEGLTRPYGRGFQDEPTPVRRRAPRGQARGRRREGRRQLSSGRCAGDGEPIATVWSPPLAALVRHMNTVS